MDRHRPDVIYHADAHRYVQLMEYPEGSCGELCY
ncbi:hypothetical protein [Priestia aryabhattai]